MRRNGPGEVVRPATDWELRGIVAALAAERRPVEVIGNGTKRAIGRPMQTGATLTTASLRGITLYEPTELVMAARSGTPLATVEAELAARGQMLAFEPIDLGPAVGSQPGAQTIGAVFAANLSGSRRIAAGAARDHLIGIHGVNGRAELFKSGGRVMKNVTGYDLPRGLSGSWGTLAVLTQVTFKVLPYPETAATLVYPGLPDDIAAELMCGALGTPYEVSGTVHLTAALAQRLPDPTLAAAGQPLTLIRVENFAPSVSYRTDMLKQHLKVYGVPIELDYADTATLWSSLRRLAVFPYDETLLWRISTAPRNGPKVVAAIRRHMQAEAMYDWSGGLVWVEAPPSADAGASDIRRAVAVSGGHATLIRAAPEIRASVDVFQPSSAPLERITRGLKAAFDPEGLLNPGRMYAGV